MKAYKDMTVQERALLSALGFVGRIDTDNPPSGWDRVNTLAALQEACREAFPDIADSPYHAQFLK